MPGHALAGALFAKSEVVFLSRLPNASATANHRFQILAAQLLLVHRKLNSPYWSGCTDAVMSGFIRVDRGRKHIQFIAFRSMRGIRHYVRSATQQHGNHF